MAETSLTNKQPCRTLRAIFDYKRLSKKLSEYDESTRTKKQKCRAKSKSCGRGCVQIVSNEAYLIGKSTLHFVKRQGVIIPLDGGVY